VPRRRLLSRQYSTRRRAVLDHHRNARLLGEFLGHHARKCIDAAAGRKADDERDGTTRIVRCLGVCRRMKSYAQQGHRAGDRNAI
jgi:hypothetical protein